jgi:hydrogenase maturation protease
MVRVVVVGFGNPLRGDDGVGVRVADALVERWADRVTFLVGHQPLPEWAATLAEADIAFVVDATVQPVSRVGLRRLRPNADRGTLDGHTLGVQQLLHLTETLYGQAPRTYVLELPAERLSFSERLSHRSQRAAAQAVRLLDRRLARLARRRCSPAPARSQ